MSIPELSLRIRRTLERYSHFLIVYGILAALLGWMTWTFDKPLGVVVVLLILRYGWRHRDDENPEVHPELLDDVAKAFGHTPPPDDDEPPHLWARPQR
jgi:hypothetical protein